MKKLKEEKNENFIHRKKRNCPGSIVILSLSSCRKDVITLNEIGTSVNNNSGGGNTAVNADGLLRKITFEASTQTVKTTVNGNVLTMVYAEDVNILLDAKGYELSYSLRFNEDFSASALSEFSYTVPGPNGTYTTDWAGNDLKVLNEVTRTQKVVDGKSMINLHLVRNFTFTKEYGSAQHALTQQNTLINTKTDLIKFNSFVVFDKEYPATTGSSTIVYTK